MKKRLVNKSNSNDISRTTVLVLVFLAVFISVLGTWTVLSTVDNILSNPQESQVTYQESSTPTGATIGLIVEKGSDENNG